MDKTTLSSLRRGTLIVTILTEGSVYLAADSRFSDSPPSERNTAQKAFLVGGNAVCGISGNIYVELSHSDGRRAVIDIPRIVGTASRRPGVGLQQLTADVVTAIRTLWSPFQDTFGGSIPDDPIAGSSMFSMLYIGRRQPLGWSLRTIRFPLTQTRLPNGRYRITFAQPTVSQSDSFDDVVAAPLIKTQGKVECIAPPYAGNLTSDVGVIDALDRIYRRAVLSGGDCGDLVGGPIDIAKLTSQGCTWLRVKP